MSQASRRRHGGVTVLAWTYSCERGMQNTILARVSAWKLEVEYGQIASFSSQRRSLGHDEEDVVHDVVHDEAQQLINNTNCTSGAETKCDNSIVLPFVFSKTNDQNDPDDHMIITRKETERTR